MEDNILEKKENEIASNNNNSNKNGIIAILIVIIVALIGALVYFAFIKKDAPSTDNNGGNNKQQQNNNQESGSTEIDNNSNNESSNSQQNNTSTNFKLEGMTFKTKDGKKALKIVSKTDSKAVKDAEQYEFIDVNDDFDYFGYYNDTLFVIYKDGEVANGLINSKYVIIGGREKGNVAQCRDTHEFVINKEDNSLVNFDYTNDKYSGHHYLIHKYGNKYYFSEGDCALSFMPINVYDENLKKIGNEILGSDKNDNFYVSYNESVIKYDKDANIIKKTSNKYNQNKIYNNPEAELQQPILTENNLYFIYHDFDKENSDYIFVDFMNDKEYITGTSDYILEKFYLDKTNNSIVIKFELNTELCINCNSDKEIEYWFDLSTNKIIKK